MYVQRADAHLRKRQHELARSDCEEALKIAPDDSDGFRCRARIDVANGAYDRAMTELDGAIQRFPRDTIALFMRAGAYVAKNDFGLAMADLDQAIRIDPNHAFAIVLAETTIWVIASSSLAIQKAQSRSALV
jgi:Tfp pilus assembly protein PilF